jgi:NADH-quinone oxidoreductase subunit N
MDQLALIYPWLVLAAGILVTMVVSVIRVNTKRPAQIFALLTLIFTFVDAIRFNTGDGQTLFYGAFEVSSLTTSLLALFSGLGIFFILGASRYLTKEKIHLSDYYHLLLILILGASVLVAAKDLVVIFIALEVMSLPAYTLAGFRRNDSRSNEAAIKYFILGGAVSAVFLLGASFVFGATGTTHLAEIFTWSQSAQGNLVLFYIGHILLLIAFLFKVAAVPFHFWKPDVYEGSPTSVSGVMATVMMAAAFVVLARLVHLVDYSSVEWAPYLLAMKQVLRLVSALSLIVGSAIVITQTNLKRMLAYSSISNTGYVLLGLLASLSHPDQIYSVWVYLFGYSLMTCGLFLLVSQSEPRADAGTELIDLTGLLKKSPFRTLMWSIFLFSMAGMPFTIGFFTKYFIFAGSVEAGEVPYVVIAAICTVVSAYAYLRPIGLMTMRDADPSAAEWKGSYAGNSVVFVSAILVFVWGVVPGSLFQVLKGIPLQH